MLLVGCQVQYHIGVGHHFFIGAHLKARFGGLDPGRPLFFDGFLAQGVGDIQAAVSEVEPLIEALSATTDDDQLFARQRCHARLELRRIHKAALAQFLKLGAEWQGVEVVGHWRFLKCGRKKGCVLCRTSCSG